MPRLGEHFYLLKLVSLLNSLMVNSVSIFITVSLSQGNFRQTFLPIKFLFSSYIQHHSNVSLKASIWGGAEFLRWVRDTATNYDREMGRHSTLDP